MPAPQPQFVPKAFALNAAPARRNVIPDTTADPQRASWDVGYPPQTMTPVVAGGKPMLGPDMNGVLYMLSSHTYYQQSGQPYRWNADVVVAIAGYAAGTLLGSTDGKTLWMNLLDGNATDPDSVGASDWVPMYSYGVTTLPPTNGGTVTVTNAQASKSVIVITGALTANLQLILPTSLRRWLIVNNTSGGFTTTVKTAAGLGVQVPQGGFGGPTEVYGDGTNIYPVVAPITLPTDVAPTPNTIALRSNAGYLYATYFNQNSAVENFSISEVFAGAGDGFLRKINKANFAANFLLSQFAGQVVNAQVPVGAVNQYRTTILNDSALTGTPTAPTPAAGDNSTRVATTAFVQGVTSLIGNGYARFSNGLILQWGYVTSNVTDHLPVVFPVAFPNAAFAAFCCTNRANSGASSGYNFVYNLSTNGATFIMDSRAGVAGGWGGYWFAIGN